MRHLTMLLIGAVVAAWAVACVAGGFASADENGPGEPVAAETLLGAAQAFVSGQGYQPQAAETLDRAIEQAIEPADPATVFLPSGRLDPLVKAVLALEQAEAPLERVRFRLRYGITQVDAGPGAPTPLSLVQIERFNLGPAIRAELIKAHGAENVAAPAEFGLGPHVSWKLAMRPLMGHRAVIVAASRKEIPAAEAGAQSCLGISCLSTGPVIDQAAPWSAMETVEFEADVVYPIERDGLLTPAAAIDLLTASFSYQMREGAGGGRPFAQAVIERNLGQGAGLDAAFRNGAQMDDSVRADWHRISAVPSGAGRAPEIYTAHAFECRRGPEFAAPGEYCP